VYIVVWTC